ncbi:MAG: type II toxin-antitoxin system ParD family antitoxin [Steroidobacteraceae bacterium]|jgi:putative addiction module CopG family antidote
MLTFRFGDARASYTDGTMPTTAVKLPAALEKFVDSQVREGTYRNREAAIIAAVSQQKRRSEQLDWLQTEIQKGLASGPTGELDIENVIRRGRRRVVARAGGARS